MSIEIMSLVFKSDLPTTEKFVLLAIADFSNSEGIAWPSITRIEKHTSLSRRAIFTSIKKLEGRGILSKKCNPNASSTMYKIHIEMVKKMHGAGGALVQEVHHRGAGDAPPLVQEVHPNHNNNHQLTTNKKEKNNKKEKIEKPEGVNEQVWIDFIQHRKRKKANITPTALKGIASQSLKAGWTLEEALIEIVSRGWVGFKADWVNKPSQSQSKPKSRYEQNMERIAQKYLETIN